MQYQTAQISVAENLLTNGNPALLDEALKKACNEALIVYLSTDLPKQLVETVCTDQKSCPDVSTSPKETTQQ